MTSRHLSSYFSEMQTIFTSENQLGSSYYLLIIIINRTVDLFTMGTKHYILLLRD